MTPRTLMAGVLSAWLTMTAAAPAGAGAVTGDDDRVARAVASAVRTYAFYTIFDDIGGTVTDGVLTLTGKVTAPHKRRDLAAIAARVEGVTQVVNRLDVLPLSPLDQELRYEIARALYGNPTFWSYAIMANPPIHIVVDRGHVTLTGVVASNVERMLARSIAASFGAFSVKNELKTEAEIAAAREGATT